MRIGSACFHCLWWSILLIISSLQDVIGIKPRVDSEGLGCSRDSIFFAPMEDMNYEKRLTYK